MNNSESIRQAIDAIVTIRGAVSVGTLHALVAERLMAAFHATLETMELQNSIRVDGPIVRRPYGNENWRDYAEEHCSCGSCRTERGDHD